MNPVAQAVTQGSPTSPVAPKTEEVAKSIAAQSATTNASRSAETFRGTNASLHAEDQCILADLTVSRADPEVGQTSTFLSYNIRNLCDEAGNASGGIEIPDVAFAGDPRQDSTVSLDVDLSSQAGQVQGTPLVASITWTKNDLQIFRSRGNSSTRTRDPETNVVTKVGFRAKNVSTTADFSGQSNLFPSNGEGSLSWDDFSNITVIKNPQAKQ